MSFCICLRRLRFGSVFLQAKVNQNTLNSISSRLCQTNSPQISNFLDNPEIQKYLHFIENDTSFIDKLDRSERENIQEILTLLQRKKDVEIELSNLKSMSSDGNKDLEKLMEEEKNNYLKDIENINDEISQKILPCDDEDENRNVELQIIPAVGGDEAKLFAEELYYMYLNYIEYKNWTCDFAELRGQKSELKNAFIKISGDWIFSKMKYEAGVHRVQRVPETEKQGRTHTSTCSIIILPQPKPFEVVIKDKDIEIEKMRSSAPGGQNVNKSQTCIRIRHLPTGIIVENQTSRHQYENKTIAFEKLRSILYNREREKVQAERAALTKQQIRTNDYSDKIRTYNFSQNRVTDHRINYSMYNLKAFMTGGKDLDQMMCKIGEFNKQEQLKSRIAQVLQSAEYKNFEKTKVSN